METASTSRTELDVSAGAEPTQPVYEPMPGEADTSYSQRPSPSVSVHHTVVPERTSSVSSSRVQSLVEDAAREAVGEGALDATDEVLTTNGGSDESRLHTVPAAQPARVAHPWTRISLTDATPIAPPEKPAQDKPWTPQTCLELADYYRGETLPQSSYKDAPYQRAVQAAISLVNKQQATYSQVDAVFRYMCGRDETLKDTWWADKKVDLWHVAEHCSTKLREIERKSNSPTPISSHPSEWPSVLLSKEKQQRNLERLRALAASRTHYHPEPILCVGTA